MERNYIDKIVHTISQQLNLDEIETFYVPHRDNEYNYESVIYHENIKNLNECNIMIAILDGKDIDSGSAFEIGYFEAQSKPVLGLLTDKRSYDEDGNLNLKLNTMIFGSLAYGINIFSNINDLINELYHITTRKTISMDNPKPLFSELLECSIIECRWNRYGYCNDEQQRCE